MTSPSTTRSDVEGSKAKPATNTGKKTESRKSGSASSTMAARQTGSPAQSTPDSAATALRDAELDSMEAALPILPRGFVENTAEVYAEVASFAVVPPEKLREYWRVYTVTHRKLYNPTANRLENFWWHVWGSQRRGLSGKTVARLYENISKGPTFVPLRTPATRYDGPTIHYLMPPHLVKGPPSTAARTKSSTVKSCASETNYNGEDHSVVVGSGNAHAGARESTPRRVDDRDSSIEDERRDNDSGEHKASQQESHVRLLSSSSSRPAPTQSILKKPRPSFSGPRPTPRFALPSTDAAEVDEEVEEQPGGSAMVNEDAATSSVGSGTGSTDTNRSDQREGHPAKAPSSGTKGKTTLSKRDHRVPKLKATKKKFVVNSSASKRKTVVSKRSGSHGSQSSNTSNASEGPGSRDRPSYLPPRDSGESLIEVEEEVEDNLLSETLVPSRSSDPNPLGAGYAVQEQVQQPPAMTDKAAGKQIARPQSLVQQERAWSPASESTAISSMSGSVAGSVTGNAVPAPVQAPVPAATVRGARSSFAQYVVTGASGAPGSLASSAGSSGLEMPLTLHNRQAAHRTSLTSAPAALSRSGGRTARQPILPYELDQNHRQQLGRIGSSTAMSSNRAALPTSLYMGSSLGGAPGLSAASLAAPQMGRSVSQDSYGAWPRLGGYPSPNLGPARSATVAAPTMVAASGIFMDGEGPDPFELYAKTGLDDALDELDGEDLPPHVPESGSFSGSIHSLHSPSSLKNVSSFSDTQTTAQQRPLFMPTRPAQTPRIPFARTRSQLNIILDREKERLGQGSYASWQESRGIRDHHEHGDPEQREHHSARGP